MTVQEMGLQMDNLRFSITKKADMMSLEGGYRGVMVYDCARKEGVLASAKLWDI